MGVVSGVPAIHGSRRVFIHLLDAWDGLTTEWAVRHGAIGEAIGEPCAPMHGEVPEQPSELTRRRMPHNESLQGVNPQMTCLWVEMMKRLVHERRDNGLEGVDEYPSFRSLPVVVTVEGPHIKQPAHLNEEVVSLKYVVNTTEHALDPLLLTSRWHLHLPCVVQRTKALAYAL